MSGCVVEGCTKEHNARGHCSTHYHLWQRANGRLCVFDGCRQTPNTDGLCRSHHKQRELGKPLAPLKRTSGQGWITKDGYRLIMRNGRRTTEHRWNMEEFLGRRLLAHETVHHINGDRLDNRIENLELWSSWHPPGQRVKDKVAWAKEILALYGEMG